MLSLNRLADMHTAEVWGPIDVCGFQKQAMPKLLAMVPGENRVSSRVLFSLRWLLFVNSRWRVVFAGWAAGSGVVYRPVLPPNEFGGERNGQRVVV